MRTFGTIALAIFIYAVPSAGFILPSSRRVPVPAVSEFVSDLDVHTIKDEVIATDLEPHHTTSTSDSKYDSSDAVTGDSSYATLAIDGLSKEVYPEPEQSYNFCRDLDGHPLSNKYFAQKLGIENIDKYFCPEEDAFSGLMSNGGRVHLFPGGETAFYKRILFEELSHAKEKLRDAPHKLIRDARSYHVVGSFLLSKGCREMVEKTGVRIPKCYDAQLEPNRSNPMKSKFSFLLEDLSPSDGWYQQWLLHDIKDCEAALSSFAKIHAFFWSGSTFWNTDVDAAEEFEAAVWESGSYVQPEAQNWNQCKIVAKEWSTKRMKFEKELSSFDYWDNLGERLESVAVECGRLAHPFADDALSEQYKRYRTFTHGDPKAANLLFRRSTESEQVQVGLIDFQWSGFGLAASDIAHFVTSAVHADRLVDGREDILLRHYYNELQKYLVEFGAFSTADDVVQNYSYDTFIEQYEIGVLDICRLMIAYTWDRFSEPVEKDDVAGCTRTFNKTSYNKSIPTIIWLLSRCDEILKSRGV